MNADSGLLEYEAERTRMSVAMINNPGRSRVGGVEVAAKVSESRLLRLFN